MKWVVDFLRRHGNELGLLFAVALVVVLTGLIDDSYLAKPGVNAKEILRQTSLLGIFALGAAIVIISGGIDLSSGSVIAFSSTICAAIIYSLAPQDATGAPQTGELAAWILVAAVAGTLVSAFLIGSFHAWLITAVRLPPFVATLASLVGLRSLARVLIQDVTDGVSGVSSTKMYVYDDGFGEWGSQWWIPLVIFLVLSLAMWVLMSRTVIGRHIYAMGGNEEAARLSGIRTARLKWLAYCIGTMTAAVAGVLYTSEIGSADPSSLAVGYELNAIAAAVVGGCGLTGGVGTIAGTMLGALFLRVVIDSVAKLVKANADDFQGLIVGVLVVLAVAFNELRTAGGLKKRFFDGALGVVNIGVLTVLAFAITSVLVNENKLATSGVTAVGVLALLSVKKFLEVAAVRSR